MPGTKLKTRQYAVKPQNVARLHDEEIDAPSLDRDTDASPAFFKSSGDARALTPQNLLRLQSTMGNQAVQRLIAGSRSAKPSLTQSHQPAPVQRLYASATFKKDVKLFGRKGKSAQFFQGVIDALQNYETTIVNSGIGDKIKFLQQLLTKVKGWKYSNQSKKSSRKKYVTTLEDQLSAEIYTLEQKVKDLTPTSFTDVNQSNSTDEAKNKDDAVGDAMNRLDLITYNFGVEQVDGAMKQVEGKEFTTYFKKDVAKDAMFGKHRGEYSGIPENNPEFGKRNIAMYEIDKLLGAGIIPPTFAAKHNGKMGVVMQKVEGKEGRKSSQEELANPLVRQGLSKLYLLDIICAQVDRHHGNYIVEMENGVIKGIKGIDNDLAFGKDYKGTDFGSYEGHIIPKQFGPLLGKMAQELTEIDQPFAQKIIQLAAQPELIRAALAGLVTDEEINSTLLRIDSLADFLRPLIGKTDGPMKTEWT